MAKDVMQIEAVASFESIAGGKGGYWEDRAMSGMRASRPGAGLGLPDQLFSNTKRCRVAMLRSNMGQEIAKNTRYLL